MFHIAVCDDEKKYCEEMQQKINQYAEKIIARSVWIVIITEKRCGLLMRNSTTY